MTKLLIIAAFLFIGNNPVWINNLDDAKVLAKKEQKHILINFSGSDWCLPCIRLHDEVFNSDVFKKFASENLVLVNVDFPRKNKNQPSKEQQKINDALAERYDPQGDFPYTLLLDSSGNKIKVWSGFYKNGVDNFIDEIKWAISIN